MQLDYSDCLLVSVVGCTGGRHVFTVAVDATLAQLHAAIAERHPDIAAFHRIIAGGKILSNVLVRKGGAGTSLESVGLRKGDKVKVVVTAEEEVTSMKALAAAEENRFNGYLPFDEELARERRRAAAAPMHARKASGSLIDFRYGFQKIEPLTIDPNTLQPYTRPPPEEAKKLLEKLANDIGIQAIMKKYEWSVGLLTELPPSLDTGIVGVSDHWWKFSNVSFLLILLVRACSISMSVYRTQVRILQSHLPINLTESSKDPTSLSTGTMN